VCYLAGIIGSKRAWGAGFLFSVSAALYLGLPAPNEALLCWKDDPDLLITLFGVLFLWTYRVRIDQPAARRLGVPMALLTITLLTKEMGLVFPVLLACVLWYDRRLDRLRDLIPMFILEAVYFAYRTYVLHGFGYRFGSNGSWLARWVSNVFVGTAGPGIWSGDWVSAYVAAAVLALGMGVWAYALRDARRPWHTTAKWAGFWAAVAATCIAIMTLTMHQEVVVSVEMPFVYGSGVLRSAPVLRGVATVIMGLVYLRMFRRHDRALYLGWFWQAVAYAPLMTAPILAHAFYLPSIGWSVWLAVPLVDGAEALWRRVRGIVMRVGTAVVRTPAPAVSLDAERQPSHHE